MTYRKSYNPYVRGLRPRRFFTQTRELSDKESTTKDVRKFNPDWNKGKSDKKRA